MKGQFKMWQAAVVLLATASWSAAQTGIPMQGGPTQGSMESRREMPPPGAVNYVEGQVSVNGQDLSSRSAGSVVVGPNQAIDTGTGYVEILLTPGAFLRIGHNSEVRTVSASLADTRVDLVHGAAMLEVAQFVKGTHIGVAMNGVSTQIDKDGLYGFDTNQQAIRVLDGKATVFETSHQTNLTKGDQVILNSNKPAKRRGFDQKAVQAEPLYVWSKVRSQDDASENVYMARDVAAYGGWYGPGWYWNPYWYSYAFLPGYGYAGSPFGWGFYSPGFFYGGYGYYGRGFGAGFRGVHAAAAYRGGFHGGFHSAGGFAGGGFHGGGGGRR